MGYCGALLGAGRATRTNGSSFENSITGNHQSTSTAAAPLASRLAVIRVSLASSLHMSDRTQGPEANPAHAMPFSRQSLTRVFSHRDEPLVAPSDSNTRPANGFKSPLPPVMGILSIASTNWRMIWDAVDGLPCGLKYPIVSGKYGDSFRKARSMGAKVNATLFPGEEVNQFLFFLSNRQV